MVEVLVPKPVVHGDRHCDEPIRMVYERITVDGRRTWRSVGLRCRACGKLFQKGEVD